MFRTEGPIPTLVKSRYPSRLVIFDTEAYREGFIDGVEAQSLRLAVARYIKLDKAGLEVESEYHYSETVEALGGWVEWLGRKDKPLYLYAHNLKYDLQLSGLLTWLLGRGWKVTAFVIEDPPTFIKLRRGRNTLIMVDTFNYWQTSLAKMGSQLGVEKLVMPSDNAGVNEWQVYCKRDVDVLSGYILEFIRFLIANDLCGLGLTLASQAFRAFRHRFNPHEIMIHNDQPALKLERAAYSGGRVEAFFIGHVNSSEYFKLDVNSMYPFVMLEKSYPRELLGYTENYPLSWLDKLLNRAYVIAECQCEVSQPVFPVRLKHKLIFPIGSFQATLHHSEIVYGLEHGFITRVLRVASYNQAEIFKDYVNFFYSLKLEAEQAGNQIIRQQAKIFLNSLYGKFGQREQVSRIIDLTTPAQYGRVTGYSTQLNKDIECNYLGSQVEIRYKGDESFYSSPAIAGAVTAYARMYLYELITAAGFDHTLYCDTDSLIVTKAGYDNLTSYLDPQRLGALKLEGVETHLTIRGAKDYEFGPEIKHKGLPKSAIQLQANLWEYEQFRGAKSWIRDGLPEGVKVYKRTKARKTPYDKGTVLESGKVIPLLLGG